jgi:hypothetical protein
MFPEASMEPANVMLRRALDCRASRILGLELLVDGRVRMKMRLEERKRNELATGRWKYNYKSVNKAENERTTRRLDGEEQLTIHASLDVRLTDQGEQDGYEMVDRSVALGSVAVY